MTSLNLIEFAPGMIRNDDLDEKLMGQSTWAWLGSIVSKSLLLTGKTHQNPGIKDEQFKKRAPVKKGRSWHHEMKHLWAGVSPPVLVVFESNPSNTQ